MSRDCTGAMRRSCVLAICLTLPALAACRQPAESAAVARRPVRRIVALSPALVEMLYAVGCGQRIVLRDRSSDYPLAVRGLPATNAFEPSGEHIAGFRPDLVLASHLDPMRARALQAVGLRVAVFDPHSVDAVLDDIEAVGGLCGRAAAARRLVTRLRQRIEAVEQRVSGRPRPSVYVELDSSDPLKPWTIGRGSFVDDLLRRAGGSNVFGDRPRSALQISAEAVVRAAPEVIVLNVAPGRAQAARQRLRARSGWQLVPAITRDRVIANIDQAVLTRPGPRFVEGLEQLAQALHP